MRSYLIARRRRIAGRKERMLKLKYVKLKTMYDVTFMQVSEHVVQINGSIPVKSAGFEIYRADEKTLLGDYSQYKTVYRELNDAVQFSNDGTIYPDDTSLVEMKKKKIQESKQKLEKYLEENPLKSTAKGGVMGVYAVTEEKQNLMMGQYITYQLEKSMVPEAKLKWNETGKECTDWTEAEFAQLILEVKDYVYPLVSFQQKLEVEINQATTREELEKIHIDFVGEGNVENNQ